MIAEVSVARIRWAATLVGRWHAERARPKLSERFEHCAELVPSFGIRRGRSSFRRMQRRLGRCSVKG
jgi:hypothetical protein